MVGTADERATGNPGKAHFGGNPLPIVELFWRKITFYGKVPGRGLEILAQGEQAAACLQQILTAPADFLGRFSQSEHETGLDRERRGPTLGPTQYLQ